MYKEIHKELEKRMIKTLDFLKDDLSVLRAGRANPKILDRIMVDYYSVSTPINQLANISAPEPRLILIQPWDVNILKEIEKAIMNSELGLNPNNDGKVIRLNIPQLTEERRKELLKTVKNEIEQAKIALRNERRDTNDVLKKMEKNSEITKDDLKNALEDVQKLTDAYIKKIDEIYEHKEKEVLEV